MSAPGEGAPGTTPVPPPKRHLEYPMLHLHGCRIGQRDAGFLIDALTAEGSASSLETAAAIRWGSIYGLTADTIEPDMKAAILKVINGGTSPALT